MKKFLTLTISLLMFTACSTLKIDTDYDDTFNLSEQSTFIIEHKNKKGEDTLTNDRIINSLKSTLKQKNYKNASINKADLIFVFHVNVENKSDIHTDYQMMGYGRYRYSGSILATTRTYDYKEGTLIVDALNPKNQKIVWRTIATTQLNKQRTLKEKQKYIDEIVQELMSSFPLKK